jgi:serine/threonine-protein kinase
MLTGRRAFDGEDVSDTLAAILRGEPDWSALPTDLPPAIAEFMKGSLVKDRRRRVADLAVASFVLSESSAARDLATRARAPRTLARRAIAASAAAILVAAGLIGAWWTGARSAPVEPGPVTRFVIPLRSGEQFSQTLRNVVAISPDGTSLAYVANGRLNLRRIDQVESVPIRGTESGLNSPGAVRSPFFSPDGRWIGFWKDGQIKKIPLAGGAAVSIAAVTSPFGATWEDDGTIVFAEQTTIWRVSEAGGTPEPLVRDLKGVPQNPQLLDGARAVLFTLFPEGTTRGEGLEPEIVVHSLDSGRQQTLIRGGIDARYIQTGHLVYFSNSTLLAVPFDLRALNTAGSPVALAEDVASGVVPGRLGNGIAQVAVSRTGTLAYITGSFFELGPRALVSVDRLGREELLGLPPRAYVYPRLSPDGARIALTVRDQELDIWIWDIERKNLSRFTFDPADDRYSLWSPDGRWIAFGSTRGSEAGVWRQAADGTGVAERLAAFPFNPYNFLLPTAMTPDGSRLVATATPGAGNVGGATPDIFVIESGADREPVPLLQSAFPERNAELSPDGAWVAYESAESGQFEIYVRPFPDVPGGKSQVSTVGGSQALWSRDGNELFFVAAAGGLMSVRVDRGGPLKTGTPTRVLDGSYVWTAPAFAGRLYDVTPDGRRFILMKDAGLSQQTNLPDSITVVQNWDRELNRLVPAN